MMRMFPIAFALPLAACAGGVGSESGQTSKSEARQVAAEQFRGVDVDGLANCVRDNATNVELAALALGGDAASEATAAVLARPETAECIRDNNIELPS